MRFLKIGLLIYLLLYCQFTVAQDSYSQEISFKTDNDLFISYVNDRYYSSGLFIEVRYLDKNTTNSLRTIQSFSLNQEIYTPFKSIVQNISEHDRPFAGYLYLNYGVSKVQQNRFTENNFRIGIVGPLALGKEFQSWIHNIYAFPEPIGWKYQIDNTLAIQFSKNILKPLGKRNRKYTDFFYSYGYEVGTVKTHTNLSLQGRIGLRPLADMSQSLAFRTQLNTHTTRNIESFFHWKIQSQFVVYDATLQGSLFNNQSPVTFNPNRLQLRLELAYMFTANSWNFGYKTIFESNERRGLTNANGHFYASIFVSKLLR